MMKCLSAALLAGLAVGAEAFSPPGLPGLVQGRALMSPLNQPATPALRLPLRKCVAMMAKVSKRCVWGKHEHEDECMC
jgi:hypothetical protein